MRGQSLYDYCMEHEDKKYLLDEWDYEKNEKELGLSPKVVARGNGRIKVWWKCKKCDNSFFQSVNNRTGRGSGCPVCVGKKIIVGINDLSTTHPELVKEWDYEKNASELCLYPQDLSRGSEKKVWWLCDMGHSYDASPYNRCHLNSGCPYCAGKKVLKGFNDLDTFFLDISKEWHPIKNGSLTPDKVTRGSNKKVWWKCKRGHEWEATVNTRQSGCGCPECAKESKSSFPEQAIYYYLKQVYKGVVSGNRNLLGNNFELDIYIPEIKTAIEYDGVTWHKNRLEKDVEKNKLCKEMGICLIRIREKGLPDIDSSLNIFRKDNNSDSTLEEVLNELFLFLGIEVDVSLERDRQEIYSQYIQSEKENSLAVKFPEIAKEWHPTKNGNLSPENVSYASNKKVWWLCERGHEYESLVIARTNRNCNCPYCSGHSVLKGFNDLCTSHPEILRWWHPIKNGNLTPDNLSSGSQRKIWWLCENGHEYETSVVNKISHSVDCPYCNNRKLLKGFNDLETVYPEVARDWHSVKNGDLKPSEIIYGSTKRAWWKCSICCYEWNTVIRSRTNGKGSGCPECGKKKRVESRGKNKENNG